jgi:alpha-ketoglutarate-dependent taurine dioxygenase
METNRLSHALGAEICGVNIVGDLSNSELEAIHNAWREHHVIVFRGPS